MASTFEEQYELMVKQQMSQMVQTFLDAQVSALQADLSTA